MADTKSLGNQGLQKYTQYIRTLANATYQPLGDYVTTADLSKYATTAQVLNNIADGQSSSALHQISSTATGQYAVALGKETKASGNYSHAEGYGTLASSLYSHAEGYLTTATSHSHSQGAYTLASGLISHAQGQHTIAQGRNQTVIGQYNIAQGSNATHTAGDYAFIIGNGTADDARSNAMSVTWNGVIDAAALDTTGDIEATGYVNATGGLFYDGTNILQLIYPIGAIYMSTNNTLPAALVSFGTWTQIKDVFLLAAGDTYTAGDTGGQATITYTPAGSNGATALSVAQMPSHYHYLVRNGNSQGATTASELSASNYISSYATAAKTDLTYSLRHHNSAPNIGRSSSQGSGNTHNHTWTGTQATLNNMPPYKVVYAWERTA